MANETSVQTAEGSVPVSQFYGVSEITPPKPNVFDESGNPVITEQPVAETDVPEHVRAQLNETPVDPKNIPADILAQLNTAPQLGETPVTPAEMPEDVLYEMADKQQFNPRTWAVSNSDKLSDNQVLNKLARVNARIKDRGFKLRDLAATADDPDPGVLSGAWNIVKKAGSGAAHLAKGVALNVVNLGVVIPAMAEPITSDVPSAQIVQTAYAETGAAMESGIAGIIEGAGTAARKVGRFFGAIPKATERTESEQLADFLNDVDKEKLRESRAAAHGPFMQAIGGEVVKSLEQKGLGPDPERISEMAGADPLSLWMFGKVFSGVHKAGAAAAPLVKPVEKFVSEVSKKAVGVPISGVGLVVEKTAKPVGAAAGAVKGGSLGGPVGALVGAERGLAGGRMVAKGATTVRQFGSQVAGLSPLSNTAALGTRAVLDAFPKFLTDTAAGVGIDLGFIAATTETPDEAGQMPLLGTAFGAGKGALSAARQAAISTKFAPDFWRRPDKWSAPFTPDESFSGLAQLHKTTLESAPDTQVARVNATNNFLKQNQSDAPVYFINDEAGLAHVLEQIYTRQGVPEASERAKFAATQDGMFTENIVDDAGRPRRVIIAKNPEAIPHEGFHGIQAVLGEAGNRPIDALTFKTYEDVWDAQGQRHAQQLTGKPVGSDWRTVIENSTGATSADVYLARELAAENFDYLFRSGIERPKGLPGKLANIVLNMTDLLGSSPLAGERTAGLGIEPKLELVENIRSRVATPPVIETPKTRKGGKPSVPVQSPPERAKQWVADKPTGLPERDAAISALSDAVNTGQGVTVLYWGAKGEPAGNVKSIRPERRAQIESQRQAENADRQLANKVIFPYRVDMTKSGPQFVGWSPDNFRANVSKLESWLSKTGQATPYEFDNATGKFSTAGLTAIEADLQTFISNQRGGFTGSGQPLVVPSEVVARGFTPPEQTGKATPLDQTKADVINYLFNTQIPESTSRVAPLHLAGQEISAATKPGRLAKPVRPRGQYSEEKLSKAGIAGPREVLEVNPFRQTVEQVSKDMKVERPSLIEVSQRLNTSRIEASAPASGEPAFGGNVLTLASGFKPNTSPRAIRAAAVIDEQGRVFTGPVHSMAILSATESGAKYLSPKNEGFVTNEGEFLNRKDALIRAKEFSQLPESYNPKLTELEAATSGISQYKPRTVTEQVQRLVDMSPDEWRAEVSTHKGKLGSGLTGWAWEVGSLAKTAEDVLALRQAAGQFQEAAQLAMKSARESSEPMKSMNVAMEITGRAQAAREAFEAATGENLEGTNPGSAVPAIRKYIDPDYNPPVPPKK